MIIGTHDTPASDITILMFGRRIGIRAYTQSTAAMTPFTGNSVTATSVGLSPEGRATEPDAPTWRLMTVSVGGQAGPDLHRGSSRRTARRVESSIPLTRT